MCIYIYISTYITIRVYNIYIYTQLYRHVYTVCVCAMVNKWYFCCVRMVFHPIMEIPKMGYQNPYERMMILPNHPRTGQYTHVLTAPAAWRVS